MSATVIDLDAHRPELPPLAFESRSLVVGEAGYLLHIWRGGADPQGGYYQVRDGRGRVLLTLSLPTLPHASWVIEAWQHGRTHGRRETLEAISDPRYQS